MVGTLAAKILPIESILLWVLVGAFLQFGLGIDVIGMAENFIVDWLWNQVIA